MVKTFVKVVNFQGNFFQQKQRKEVLVTRPKLQWQMETTPLLETRQIDLEIIFDANKLHAE